MDRQKKDRHLECSVSVNNHMHILTSLPFGIVKSLLKKPIAEACFGSTRSKSRGGYETTYTPNMRNSSSFCKNELSRSLQCVSKIFSTCFRGGAERGILECVFGVPIACLRGHLQVLPWIPAACFLVICNNLLGLRRKDFRSNFDWFSGLHAVIFRVLTVSDFWEEYRIPLNFSSRENARRSVRVLGSAEPTLGVN